MTLTDDVDDLPTGSGAPGRLADPLPDILAQCDLSVSTTPARADIEWDQVPPVGREVF